MLHAFIEGFILHASLIVAIGVQSAFLIRCGLRGEHVFLIASLCSFYDIFFLTAGVMGVGSILSTNDFLRQMAGIGSIIFFLVYSGKSFYDSFFSSMALEGAGDVGPTNTAYKVFQTSIIVTFLNPQAYVDTFLVIGGYAAQFQQDAERIMFGIGLWVTSLLWFYGLGYGASLLAPFTKNPKVWKILDFVTGTIFLYLSYKMLHMIW
jgi:L-lysine exporter family protein LysE/ArgO